MRQQQNNKPHTSMSDLMDGQLIAHYINSDINSECYIQAKQELEKRRYHLEQIILQSNKKGKK
jgi:phosphosulfolactate phosphohydrolase-like enzyme